MTELENLLCGSGIDYCHSTHRLWTKSEGHRTVDFIRVEGYARDNGCTVPVAKIALKGKSFCIEFGEENYGEYMWSKDAEAHSAVEALNVVKNGLNLQ